LPRLPEIQQYLAAIGVSVDLPTPEPGEIGESGGKTIQRMLRAKRRRAMLTFEDVSA